MPTVRLLDPHAHPPNDRPGEGEGVKGVTSPQENHFLVPVLWRAVMLRRFDGGPDERVKSASPFGDSHPVRELPRAVPRERPCHAGCHAENDGPRRVLTGWDGRPNA